MIFANIQVSAKVLRTSILIFYREISLTHFVKVTQLKQTARWGEYREQNTGIICRLVGGDSEPVTTLRGHNTNMQMCHGSGHCHI